MHSHNRKDTRVRALIREQRRKQTPMRVKFLSDLDGDEPDKKTANKFLLGCILDYQMKVDVVWENARRLAEDDLGDPGDLWRTILAIPRWNTESVRRRYNLHRSTPSLTFKCCPDQLATRGRKPSWPGGSLLTFKAEYTTVIEALVRHARIAVANTGGVRICLSRAC